MSLPNVHAEHWQEPANVTAERPEGDKYCESCGEEIPWHTAACSMLKNAYKRRYSKCHFCDETHRVGDLMREHVEKEHADEVVKMLYQ